MKIQQYYERDGVRLEVTIESKDVITHSNLQKLTEAQIEGLKFQLQLAAGYTRVQIIGITNGNMVE